METVYLNNRFLPKEEAWISPDDRGFLFGDGIYEVVRWYGKAFFDMNGHLRRLKRSLGELKIIWDEVETFPSIAARLVGENRFENNHAMVYLQVTRGAARRTHYFPMPEVKPTVYAFAFTFTPDETASATGIRALLKPDIRWSRCDIKSIALLPNTMSFQEAYSQGYKECIFARDGIITEGAHSNIFFVKENSLYTHPESNHILSGITRNNIIRMAKTAGIQVIENAIREAELHTLQEAFISNTSAEVAPVVGLGDLTIGAGSPGPVTRKLQEIFRIETEALKE